MNSIFIIFRKKKIINIKIDEINKDNKEIDVSTKDIEINIGKIIEKQECENENEKSFELEVNNKSMLSSFHEDMSNNSINSGISLLKEQDNSIFNLSVKSTSSDEYITREPSMSFKKDNKKKIKLFTKHKPERLDTSNDKENINENKLEISRKSMISDNVEKKKLINAKQFILKAKEWENLNDITLALDNYQKAYEVLPDHPTILAKIKKLKSMVSPKENEVLEMNSDDVLSTILQKNEYILLNIFNKGNLKQLMSLKQIGKKRAEQIISVRDNDGQFENVY